MCLLCISDDLSLIPLSHNGRRKVSLESCPLTFPCVTVAHASYQDDRHYHHNSNNNNNNNSKVFFLMFKRCGEEERIPLSIGFWQAGSLGSQIMEVSPRNNLKHSLLWLAPPPHLLTSPPPHHPTSPSHAAGRIYRGPV